MDTLQCKYGYYVVGIAQQYSIGKILYFFFSTQINVYQMKGILGYQRGRYFQNYTVSLGRESIR